MAGFFKKFRQSHGKQSKDPWSTALKLAPGSLDRNTGSKKSSKSKEITEAIEYFASVSSEEREGIIVQYYWLMDEIKKNQDSFSRNHSTISTSLYGHENRLSSLLDISVILDINEREFDILNSIYGAGSRAKLIEPYLDGKALEFARMDFFGKLGIKVLGGMKDYFQVFTSGNLFSNCYSIFNKRIAELCRKTGATSSVMISFDDEGRNNLFLKISDPEPDIIARDSLPLFGIATPEIISKGLDNLPFIYGYPGERKKRYHLSVHIGGRDFRVRMNKKFFSITPVSARAFSDVKKHKEDTFDLFCRYPESFLFNVGRSFGTMFSLGTFDSHDKNNFAILGTVKPGNVSNRLKDSMSSKEIKKHLENDGRLVTSDDPPTLFLVGAIDLDSRIAHSYAKMEKDGRFSFSIMEDYFSDYITVFFKNLLSGIDKTIKIPGGFSLPIPIRLAFVDQAFGSNLDGPFGKGLSKSIQDFQSDEKARLQHEEILRQNEGVEIGISCPQNGGLEEDIKKFGLCSKNRDINGIPYVITSSDGRTPLYAEGIYQITNSEFMIKETDYPNEINNLPLNRRIYLIKRRPGDGDTTIDGKDYSIYYSHEEIPSKEKSQVILLYRREGSILTNKINEIFHTVPTGIPMFLVPKKYAIEHDRVVEFAFGEKSKYAMFFYNDLPRDLEDKAISILCNRGAMYTMNPGEFGFNGSREVGAIPVLRYFENMDMKTWKEIWKRIEEKVKQKIK